MGKSRFKVSGIRGQNKEHLLTADCLLHLRESGWRGFFAGMAALDKMSPATVKEKTSKFKK